ncbi:TPA: hypothetical protein I8V37_002524 [Corynebacterium striatum]|nr:hypothetical protein [Corynebacterium striatum]HAT1264774.1 hypothetical protein [Corynebacterium striatum]HAT1415671.1 hypothetical protein [Corynebacterium striatum]HAT1425750.1 hypothetical protein [Corynebacterium striatum]HAT1430850.1 hypothetical protein [Corynebacterium striatum]
MTNIDKAADLLYQRSKELLGVDSDAAHRACKEHAQALADAGLIMTDLPEPSYTVTECEEEYPVWEPGSGYSIEKEAPGEVTVSYHGEPAEPLTPQEARSLAAALLAAASHTEEA